MSTRTLLFSDLVDSTALIARVGDAQAAAIWTGHDRRARQLLKAHHGQEIDRSDGFFMLFANVGDAAAFAQGYHAALADLGLSARVGIHAGEVRLRRNSDEDIAAGAQPLEVDGLAKPLAARIMSLARAEQTLLSDARRSATSRQARSCRHTATSGSKALKSRRRCSMPAAARTAQGSYEQAQALYAQALVLQEQAGNSRGLIGALWPLAEDSLARPF